MSSNPPGAVVYLNDREIGRTPFKREFTWYGNYDVVVRKQGYETLTTTKEVTAPFWQFVPFDLVTDFLPLKDDEAMSFELRPEPPTSPEALMYMAESMRNDLETSQNTVNRSVLQVHPATRPTSQPTTSTANY